MSSYHTQALAKADIFTIMGSVYAEVARYDSALAQGHTEQALQAVSRTNEIIAFAQSLTQLNNAQKQEIKKFNTVFSSRVKKAVKSELDSYLMPFAVATRLRQFP